MSPVAMEEIVLRAELCETAMRLELRALDSGDLLLAADHVDCAEYHSRIAFEWASR